MTERENRHTRLLESPPRRLPENLRGISRSPFTVWTLRQFEEHTPTTDDAILGETDGTVYWRDREPAMLVGPSGVGKSRLSLQLALAQITGSEFVGLKTFVPPRKWLLMGNENSTRRCKEELEKMLCDATQEQRARVQELLRIQAVTEPFDASLSLDDEEARQRWRDTAAMHRPDILVVDPWEAVIRGNDCNDAAATRDSLQHLCRLFSSSNSRSTLLIVHHAREGAEAARKAEGADAGAYVKGSKTLRSIVRFGINVAPEDPTETRRIVIACGKVNNSRGFATRGAILNESTCRYELNAEFSLARWRADYEGKRSNKSSSIRDVVDAVKAGADKTAAIVEYVRVRTGACDRTVKQRIHEAVRHGELARSSPTGHYVLSEKNRA